MSIRRFFVVCAFALAGCVSKAPGLASEVAIYMPVQPMSGREILAADLSSLALEPEPIIPMSEIVSYAPATHELALTSAAVKRLAALRVPVEGLGFVISVEGKPSFAGAFWPLYSSLSFDGLTIQVPLRPGETSVHLYSGYPGGDASLPNDPREDPRLLGALRQAGKLR